MGVGGALGLTLLTVLVVLLLGVAPRRRSKDAASATAVTTPAATAAKDSGGGGGATVKLASLDAKAVPEQLRVSHYFDLRSNPLAHAELLTFAHDVVDVLNRIPSYCVSWLRRNSFAHRGFEDATFLTDDEWPEDCEFMLHGSLYVFVDTEAGDTIFAPDRIIGGRKAEANFKMEPIDLGSQQPVADSKVPDPNAQREQAVNARAQKPAAAAVGTAGGGLHVCRGSSVIGATLDTSAGGIFIGRGARIEPGVVVKGPAIIGAGSSILSGAYLRGPVIIGQEVCVRCEVKNAMFMDRASLTHPGYVGDSIIGYNASLGCQAVISNLGLLGSKSVIVSVGETAYDLGRRKIGGFIGDHSRIGSNSVIDPGTFVGPHVHVYSLSKLRSGFYGPREVIKSTCNLERAPLDMDKLSRRQQRR
uniref:Uncharacterized protein n=1 Tax=Phaeomonas parva TaxID=124430 RepID=A0A7S1U6B6_9STRA|mmetsp:Transcript_33690/g.106479  ORF Transcript_33690/g.106479 Transcript_33690/m.106479 type:complete len:417 (+) Transcript_33690:137-1387(+)